MVYYSQMMWLVDPPEDDSRFVMFPRIYHTLYSARMYARSFVGQSKRAVGRNLTMDDFTIRPIYVDSIRTPALIPMVRS